MKTSSPHAPRAASWPTDHSLLLGMLVVVLGAVAVRMGFSAHDARNDANVSHSFASVDLGRVGLLDVATSPAR